MSGISLSSAMRTNLLSLQNTQNLIGSTQNRLATGLKVSSALDNPQAFFQAQGFNNRANDLNRLQDSMGLAVKTIEAADKGLKAMTKVAESMIGIAREARATQDVDRRTELQDQFNALREQLATVARDSGFNGTNLLQAGNTLNVSFNEDETSTLTVNGTTGIGADVFDATGDFVNTEDTYGFGDAEDWNDADAALGLAAIEASIEAVQDAIGTMRTDAAVLGTNLTLIKVREDFTKEIVNTLRAGADGLTLADQNEEAANLLTLQTRQQIGIQALSLASQSQQGILRLF